MFINHVDYQKLDFTDLNGFYMQDHFKYFYIDLYASYKMVSEINDMVFVYRYEDIAACLFNNDQNQLWCSQSDSIIFPSWGMILDSNCAVPELWLKNRYQWTASLLDIRDCGSLCVYYAIHLIIQIIKNAFLSRVTCCTIENVTPVKNTFCDMLYPEVNYAALLSFSSARNSSNDIEILYSGIHRNKRDISLNQTVIETTHQIAQQYGIHSNKYHAVIRDIGEDVKAHPNIDLILHPISSGFLYYILNQIQKIKLTISSNYVFVIDIDSKKECFGILLVKCGESHVSSIAR